MRLVPRLLTPLLLLFPAGPLAAADPFVPPSGVAPELSLPAEVTVTPGEPELIEAKTTARAVAWAGVGIRVFPQYDPGSLTALKVLVITSRPGRYHVVAAVAGGDVPRVAVCAVTVGTPGPGPGPTPPGPLPPGPNPNPAPADPFTQALQAAYDQEAGTQKGYYRDFLAALYGRCAAELAAGDAAGRATLGDYLTGYFEEARRQHVPEGEFARVRRAVGDELNKTLPRQPALPLDAPTRGLLAREFARAAAALKGVR